jgi:predicted RND superfamily exporter protein
MDIHHNKSTEQLDELKTSMSLSKELIGIFQKYDSDPLLYEEAIRQASRELAQIQTVLDNSLFTS